jgi:hypothetical protein
VRHVGRHHPQHGVRRTGHGEGLDDLRRLLEVRAHGRERHGAVGEQGDQRLELPAHGVRVDDGGEAADRALPHEPVDPPLGGRDRQAHPAAEVGVGGPPVTQQQPQDPLVQVVHGRRR